MQVRLSDEAVEIRLSTWEKVVGLMGNMRFARSDVYDVQVLDDGVGDAMSAPGLKAGLRLPWIRYVCRSLALDRAWVVRRDVPALSFSVREPSRLRHVTVSTPDAADLAAALHVPAA